MTKAELVHRAIRGDIMAGRLAPGTPLDEVVLAGVHEVSRTPVREALGRLSTDGLAVAGPRRQVLVVHLSDERRTEIVTIRATLEGAAAPRACQLVTDEDLDELQLSVIKQRRLAASGASEEFMEFDEHFHRRLAQIAQMATLSQFLDQLGAFVRLTRIGAATPPTHMHGLVAEHEQIIRLLEDRNATELATVLAHHIRSTAPRHSTHKKKKKKKKTHTGETMKTFIIGAAGGVGRRLAVLLAGRGEDVTGMHRSPDQADTITATGAVAISGDLIGDSIDDLTAKLTGQDAVVFSAGAHGTGRDKTTLIDGVGVEKTAAAAAAAGVTRFVLVSAFPESNAVKGSVRASSTTCGSRRPPTSTSPAPTWTGSSCGPDSSPTSQAPRP